MADEGSTETEIAPARAAELIDSGAAVIDVRRPYEWDAGRIEGARHIEMNELAGEAEAVPRNRSALAAGAFRQAGWDAYNLAGGLQAWVEHGLDLDPPDGEVAPPQPGT